MKAELGRIVFAKNPWPKGHRIHRFAWTGRVEADSVWFDFDLETASYNEGDDPHEEDAEVDDDWRAKIVWNNYHRCSLSSVKWGRGESTGALVGTPKKPLDFGALGKKPLRIDRTPKTGDESPAFHIYLLGHDAVADHTIAFTKNRGTDTYAIAWRGRICLAYIGRTKYEHAFMATLPAVAFGGFSAGPGVDRNAARDTLRRVVIGGEKFSLAAAKKAATKVTKA